MPLPSTSIARSASRRIVRRSHPILNTQYRVHVCRARSLKITFENNTFCDTTISFDRYANVGSIDTRGTISDNVQSSNWGGETRATYRNQLFSARAKHTSGWFCWLRIQFALADTETVNNEFRYRNQQPGINDISF